MNHDPHYQRIIEGLKRVSDGNHFERCVTDLLRHEHSTLIPVPGGSDAGMDGAWVDAEGNGFLIATVAKNVIGNVTRNLESHQESGGKRKRVLVATTQDLTKRRCDNIEKRVEEFGCTLAHYPYTLLAIADRLYHNARWCQELLGISSRASALSKVPHVARHLRDLPLIGRDDALEWLQLTIGDRLIVGQPGVGKTFLAQKLVDQGRALFVTSDNSDAIVEAIRDQQPSLVILEDAHRRLETLESLQRFRVQVGTTYEIVADSWPGGADDVRSLLGLDEDHVYELKPLSSESIVDVIHAAGITGPYELMHQLVRQSLGYPGRAALLVHSCLSGGIGEVWKGEALARWVTSTLRRLVNDEAVQILAALAIGGKRGMPIDSVAQLLEIGAGEIRRQIAELAASGVVYEIDTTSVAVYPEQVRSILVRDHFFRPTAPLPFREFLAHARKPSDFLYTIIRAKGVGANVPSTDLLDLLERVNDHEAWKTFVWTDRQHAEIILSRYPDRIIQLAEPLLYRIPERAIPAILRRVSPPVDDHTPGLNEIREWIKSAEPGRGEALTRRQILAVSLVQWFAGGGAIDIGLALISAAIRPGFGDYQQDPGDWRRITIRNGVLNLEELRGVASLWKQISHALQSLRIEDWRPVIAAIDQWIYPSWLTAKLRSEESKLLTEAAAIMLQDVVSLAAKRPGVLAKLRKRAGDIGMDLGVEVDPVFAVLFPQDPHLGDWRERRERQVTAARTLAVEWASENPSIVASKLAACAHEAADAGIVNPNYTGYVCQIVSENTDLNIPWVDALLTVHVRPDHVCPFLETAAAQNESGWEDQAVKCMRDDTHAYVGLSLLLRKETLNKELLQEVLAGIKKFPDMVRSLCQRGEVAEDRIMSLLQHETPDVVEATAIGLWDCEPEGTVPAGLYDVWKSAFSAHVTGEYDLGRVFEHNADVAFEWLLSRARTKRPGYNMEDKSIAVAASVLSLTQKREILAALTQVNDAGTIAASLIGNDVELYRAFLADTAKTFAHLAPLRGKPCDDWANLAVVALESGYSVEEIARCANTEGGSFVGSISEMFARQAEEWEPLESHKNPRVREIAHLGKQASLSLAEQCRRDEEKEEYADMYLG